MKIYDKIFKTKLHSTKALRSGLIALIGILSFTALALAQSAPITLLPPREIGSTALCSGGNQILSYSADTGSGHAGINCSPVSTDSFGNLSAAGNMSTAGSLNATGNIIAQGPILSNLYIQAPFFFSNTPRVVGQACPTTGMIGTDGTGAVVSCQGVGPNGIWTSAPNSGITGSNAQNGWVKFPNGLIMQWGNSTVPVTNQNNAIKAVVYPIPFPNNVLNISLTTQYKDWGSNSSAMSSGPYNWTKTGFMAGFDHIGKHIDNGGGVFYWTAIGF